MLRAVAILRDPTLPTTDVELVRSIAVLFVANERLEVEYCCQLRTGLQAYVHALRARLHSITV